MSDTLHVDVVIVGAGPAGLAAAIRLKQLAQYHQENIRVCMLEKGSEVGAHILSGAVLEPRALDELVPDWKAKGAPLHTPVTEDRFYFLTRKKAWRLPTPPQMHNAGNYIVSLGNVCRWLAREAEALGVEIYPGFAVAKCLFDEAGKKVIGVETTPVGLDKQGNPTARYEPGVQIFAQYTLIAEGCRGSIAEYLIKHFNLRQGVQPQTYGIGVKELWEVDPAKHRLGQVVHTIGWPMDHKTYGGSFIYHLDNHQVALGFVVGLDYQNPYLSPFDELQRFKHHPVILPLLEGGRRIAYGARALNEGGYQSIPRLNFEGGALIGCAAGFLNVPKIKGSHTAMKSGMIAAEFAYETIMHDKTNGKTQHQKIAGKPRNKAENKGELNRRIEESWVGQELKKVRNIRPGFRCGLVPGLLNAVVETYILRGRAWWTLSHHVDHQQLKPAQQCVPIHYPKPDGNISFDKLTSVFLSYTNHNEHQPCHLILKDASVPLKINLPLYDAPERRYCPAGVYEVVEDAEKGPRLEIHAQNCIHCKTCDIKDPTQNIQWVPPEGGGGPHYPNM
jgi:electron-transferring-flavoprotein dehydrogenase